MGLTDQDRVQAYQKMQEHVNRYFKALYGDDYVYRAPETFPNMLERWMLYATRPTKDGELMAEQAMTKIEEHLKNLEKS